MHLRIDAGDAVFFAEFQNDPAAGLVGTEDGILHTDLTCKLTRQARGAVPPGTEVLTAFIDVQGKALFYMVVAWARNMTGAIIDYGCEPEQPMRYFTLREVQKTLLKAAPGCGLEAAIRAALDRLTARLLGRAWTVERNGVPLRIEKCLVDAGWGETSDLVYEFCRNSPHAAVLMPSKGVGISAGRTPLGEWNRAPGDRIGLNWRVPAMAGRRHCRHVLFDTNFWKSCVAARIKTAYGDPGSMYLYGEDAEPHRLLLDHLSSERPTLVTANGRSATQWELITVGRDNHWWDCLVGAAVGANMLRITPPGLATQGVRERVSLAKLAEEAARRRTG
jgi:phage terminase large subunit GpA-like protein